MRAARWGKDVQQTLLVAVRGDFNGEYPNCARRILAMDKGSHLEMNKQ